MTSKFTRLFFFFFNTLALMCGSPFQWRFFCSDGIKSSFMALCSPLVVTRWNSSWSEWSRVPAELFSRLCFFPSAGQSFVTTFCFSFYQRLTISFKFSFKKIESSQGSSAPKPYGEHCFFSVHTNINAVYLSVCQCFVFCNTGGRSFPRAHARSLWSR